jgi:Leucine Rich repeat
MTQPRLIFSLRDSPGYVDGRSYKNGDLRAVPGTTVTLSLENSSIGDAGIVQLPPLPALRCLDLDSTKITDKSLVTLARLAALEELWLECTNVSNVGLQSLHLCKNLRFVSLAYTGVSAGGIAALKSAIPGVTVSA